MVDLIFSIMIIVAAIAKLLIFIKCHKTKKYYCDNDECHLKYYCGKYHSSMGFLLLQMDECLKELEKAEKAAD